MKILNNPQTSNYADLKNFILGDSFPWFWNDHFVYKGNTDYFKDGTDAQDIPFFTHSFLNRPKHTGEKYPTVNSPHIGPVSNVVNEIFDFNSIKVKCVYRMNANLMQPQKGNQKTFAHIDHDFPHKNLIVYLTNVGGETVCGEERHDPKENDIISFEGIHYNMLPKKGRRIVLVATYLE